MFSPQTPTQSVKPWEWRGCPVAEFTVRVKFRPVTCWLCLSGQKRMVQLRRAYSQRHILEIRVRVQTSCARAICFVYECIKQFGRNCATSIVSRTTLQSTWCSASCSSFCVIDWRSKQTEDQAEDCFKP
jgi:hypothetical protein